MIVAESGDGFESSSSASGPHGYCQHYGKLINLETKQAFASDSPLNTTAVAQQRMHKRNIGYETKKKETGKRC